MGLKKLIGSMGPGLLYAGAAVGVSHLVQSTRAGADYYFDLVIVLFLANALKYPFFEFGPRYSSATGKSLIDGYRELGRWAVVLFALLTILSMFAIQGAVTIVTAGIAADIFKVHINPALMSAVILSTTMLILIIGKYKVLDSLIKVVILVLTVSTIVAVVSAFFTPSASPGDGTHFDWVNATDIFFLIAFVGWMPSPIDVSVWQSLWTLAKKSASTKQITWKESRLDFNIGYIGTAVLAMGFLTLGAKIMFGTGQPLAPDGVTFSQQLISMYTTTIGHWAYYFIALAALTTMYSTTLTVVDAIPRVMENLTLEEFPVLKSRLENTGKIYWVWMVILVAGTLVLLTYLASSMRFMVDLATTLSFITAPLLAYLNYRVVTHKHMPVEARPEKWLRAWSWAGIAFLGAFTVFYLLYRIFNLV